MKGVVVTDANNPQSPGKGRSKPPDIQGDNVRNKLQKRVQEPSEMVDIHAAQLDPRSTHTLTVRSLSIDPDAIIFC